MSATSCPLVLDVVKSGFADADEYEKNRPSYTEEAVEEVVAMALTNQEKLGECKYDILELGAGTGKFTRQLLRKISKDIKIIATEPLNNFFESLKKTCPDIPTLQCSASKIPLPDHSVKAMVGAQCFHWFANQESLSEIRRVLKPGGNLVLIWNARNLAYGINRAYYEFTANYSKDAPDYIDMKWKKTIDAFGGMSLQVRKYIKGVCLEGPIELFLGYLSTISFISCLCDKDKEEALDKMRHLLETHSDTKGKEVISISMKTDILHYKAI